jgi:proton-translocating NADH-quinone oxidoreductase chain N
MSIPAFVWVMVLPLAASPLLYFAGRLSRRPALARWLCVLALAVAWFPFIQAVPAFGQPDAETYRLGAITLQWDGLAQLLTALVLGLSALVALFSTADVAGEPGEEKYFALLLVMVGVLIGLACAADLFNLWVWFEALAVSTYFLVAFHREQPASLEAAVKYLVQSAAGTSLVVLGIALVLMQTGTLDLRAIAKGDTAVSPALLAAGGLFVVGFGVKAALVPLHSWLPDAHAQAPSGVSAALSGVVIAAGLVALLRAVVPLVARNGLGVDAGLLFMSLGAINMLYGNLLALRQSSVKRLLAFSSLSHMGYMLLGVGITLYADKAGGAQGGFFHLLNHGMLKGLAFLAAGALVYALQNVSGPQFGLQIADLAGAARRYPEAALALSLAVLGLGGLPPLAGFMSKWQIFVAGFVTHDLVVELFVVFAAFNSVLSLAYYAPLVNTLYRRESSAAVLCGRRIPAVMQIPLLGLSLAVLVVGIWPGLLQGLTGAAGTALLAAASQ